MVSPMGYLYSWQHDFVRIALVINQIHNKFKTTMNNRMTLLIYSLMSHSHTLEKK